MNCSEFLNKALIDENTDLEFSIKDKVIIGKPLQDDFETESIGKLLLKNLNNFPDHVGQINVHTGKKTTFAEIKDLSVRCALWLKKQGIGKGDVVCTSIPLQDDDYVPCLATLFIGAIINPWYHHLNPLVQVSHFKSTQPKLMFAWDEGIDALVSAAKNAQVDCKFVVVGKHPDYPSLSDLLAEQDQIEIDEFQHVEPEDPKKQVGTLMFSSGTTSNSKVIMLPYEAMVNNRYHYVVTRSHSNLLMYSSLSWSTGLHFFTTCIRKHLTRIIHSEFNAEDTAGIIEKFKVHQAFLTPTMITQLCKSDVLKKHDFSKLETIFIGGSKPSGTILETIRKALPNTLVSNSYGISEAAGTLAIQTRKCKTKDSVGRVVGSVQLKIIDQKTGLPLGANQEGELYFKLDTLMLGYLNDPKETKEAIDDEGWYHSGDLGYYDDNGEVWVTDRIKQIIIYKNLHLPSTVIEDILLQHPGVADVAVTPVPHKYDIERPFAFVVKKPGAKVTSEELKELPASYDERFRLIGGVKFIDKIPYNSNGKKIIKELKEMARAYVEN